VRLVWRALADDALARLEARSVDDLLEAIPRLVALEIGLDSKHGQAAMR
jgi:hypothetical protein